MRVDINELQQIMDHLLSKIKESKGNQIVLNNDFYWDIPLNELYDPYNEPKNISLGQLSDDLEEIRKIQKLDNAIPYDLKRIANIIIAISVEYQIAF